MKKEVPDRTTVMFDRERIRRFYETGSLLSFPVYVRLAFDEKVIRDLQRKQKEKRGEDGSAY